MAKFCAKCGTPAVNDEVKFCSKCGASMPAASPAQAPAPPPAAAAAAPTTAGAAAKSSGGWIKVLVGIMGFFVVVGVLGVATCAYVAYKAKKKFDQAKAEYGLGNNGPAAQARDVCSLVTKEEVSQFTGVPITRAEGTMNKCDYASESNPVVVETDVGWQGGALGLKLGVAALRNMGPIDTTINVPDIGDEAYTIGLKGQPAADMQKEAQQDQSGMVKGMTHVMAEAPLMFRKGDVMVTVRVMQASDPDMAKRSIAKAIAARL
jgi:hypothetical protein